MLSWLVAAVQIADKKSMCLLEAVNMVKNNHICTLFQKLLSFAGMLHAS